MNILSLLVFFAFIVYLYLSIYAVRLDHRSQLNRTFSYLCLCFAIWAFAYTFFYSAPDKETAWFWYKVSSPGWCFFPGLALHFFLILTERQEILRKKYVYLLLYLPGFAFTYKALSDVLLVKDFVSRGTGWCEVPPPGSVWFWSYPAYYTGYILAGLLLTLQWGYRGRSRERTRQANVIVATALPVLITTAVTDTILPALHILAIPSVASILILLWVFGIWYAIVHYRLMILTPSVAIEKIIAEMLDLLILVDPHGTIREMNPRAREILGYEEGELTGASLGKVIEGDFMRDEFPLITRNTYRPHHKRELYYRTKKGEDIPVDVSCSAIVDREGDTMGVVIVGQDLRQMKQLQQEIIERERAEDALQRSNRLLQVLSNAQSQFIAGSDPRRFFDMMLGDLLSLTQSEYGFIGEVLYSSEGTPFLKTHSITNIAWNPETAEFYERFAPVGMEFFNLNTLFGSVMKTGEPLFSNAAAEDPRRGGLPEGHPPLRAFLGLPFHRDKKLVGIVGLANRAGGYDAQVIEYLRPLLTTCANIVDSYRNDRLRREAEEAIKSAIVTAEDEKAKTEAIIAAIGDGISIQSSEFIILYQNLFHKEIFGDHVGERCHEAFQRSDRVCDGCPAVTTLKDGRIHTVERSVVAEKGKLKVEITASPLRDSRGRIIATINVCRDVTYRRKMEEELLKTEKLESLGILAGGIAHDFNNLLTAIFGNISLCRLYMKPDERAYGILTDAEKALSRATRLTQQLLTFSKGGAPVKKIASIRRLVEDAADFALRGTPNKCEFLVEDDPWAVDVDEGQMSQVFHNLVINASQAMARGGTIRIRFHNVSLHAQSALPLKEGRYVKISVEDQGVGIEREHIKKIFDPYFTTKQGGNGLGLATAYSVIKKHDGLITVQSAPGAGTSFRVYLPASDGTTPESAEPVKTLLPGKGRILVMDDEEVVRMVIGSMLRELGYEVELAEDGRKAVECYKEARESASPFDAVIVDLTVRGGMGGIECMAKLREVDPGVKAIVSSGYSDDPVMSDYRTFGFKGVIIKPYQIETLSEVLRETIKSCCDRFYQS